MLWNALQSEYVLDAKYSHWNVLNLATNYKYRVTLLYAENMYCTLLNIYNNFQGIITNLNKVQLFQCELHQIL